MRTVPDIVSATEKATPVTWAPASRHIWLAVAALFVFFRCIAFLPTEINSFATSHYLFTYAMGFHKRALPGAVFDHWFGQISAREIYAVSLGVLAIFAAGLLLFIRRALLASKEMVVLAVALLGAPAVLPHFANELGYFDPVLVLCALLTAAALEAPIGEWAGVLLAFVPSAVGVLTHESYLLAAFPIAFASTWLSGKPRKSALLVLMALVLVFTIGVQALGRPSIPVDVYVAQQQSRAGFPLNSEAFELLYFNLKENYSYLLRHYSSLFTDARLVAAFIVPIPYFVLLYDLFRLATGTIRAGALTKRVLSLCTIAPLLLIFVGFDALRWVSLACLTCSLLVFECVRLDESGAVRDVLAGYVRSARFGVLILFSFALAPFHVVDGNAIATGIHYIAHGVGLVTW